MKTVKVTTNNIMSIINVDFDDFRDIQRAIDCECFETVRTERMRTVFGDDSLIMIVDESGILKNLPLNMLGCVLYGTNEHEHPIVGDLIFARVQGEDIVGLNDPEQLMQMIQDRFIGIREDNSGK